MCRRAGWRWPCFVVFGFSLLRGLARRAATTYTVTDRRLVIERGLVRRDLQEAPLWRIQNVFAHQTVRQRLLGVGSVHFDTAAGAEFDFCFSGVERPRALMREVDGPCRSRGRARRPTTTGRRCASTAERALAARGARAAARPAAIVRPGVAINPATRCVENCVACRKADATRVTRIQRCT